jgi:hypothetical protein
MTSNSRLLSMMAKLDGRIRLVEEALIPEEERLGLDCIRNEEDLEIAIKFQLEVYYEGKTEAVWAAEHPREYERLQRIAGIVPVMKTSGT